MNEDNVQEHITSFGANDNTEVVEQETIIVDPVEPEVLVEPIEPEESVEPEEPIFIDDPLGPIQDDVLMYGGPAMCDNMISPEPHMYGDPIDDLYDIE